MSIKRLSLLILLLLIGCQQASISRDKPAQPVNAAPVETKLDEQLEINREALLKGPSEEIRIKAATVMLSDENLLARKVLLDALKPSENSAARVAVCKTLIKARAEQKSIEKSEDFITPLFEILRTEQEFAIAKLAAEATLVFEYEQVSEQLEKMITDASLPVKARLNAIYALKLHPDMGAIFELIELLDDSEKQIAAASEEALKSLGIPIGKDAETRTRIKNELRRKGKEQFLRDWLIRQENRMGELEREVGWWRMKYLAALGKIYVGMNGDVEKGKFLAEHLRSSEKIVRLWALEKVLQLRVGGSELPDELGPLLVNLISHQDRDVRLKTAKLLSLMGELNSAEKLLEQLRIEEDKEVGTELFVALGVAVSYALSDPQIKVSPEIGEETLEWAAKYLSEADPKKSQKGAEVVKKLLEQNGLTSADVGEHLGLLAERYKQAKESGDGALRGELLSRMAGLCAQESACKVEAARHFGRLFEESLGDETDFVREAAVDGLLYIGKTKVLIRKGDLLNDSSIEIRRKLINLVGEIGGKEDLVRLWEKIGSTVEGNSAWEAMLKIFNRSEAAVLDEWIDKLSLRNPENKLSDEQRLSVLEIAERKAVQHNKAEMLKGVREELAEVYRKGGKFKQAAEYFGMLLATAQTREEEESILSDLLDAHLRWPNVEMAAKLVDNCLLRRDLEPNSPVVLSIEQYLSEPPVGTDPNAVLRELLGEIKPVENRPKWQEQLERWMGQIGRAKGPDKPERAGN